MVKNIPNIITITRLLFVIPMGIALYLNAPIIFAVLFLLGKILDAVDGYLARKYGWVSDLGSKLDSLADTIFDPFGMIGFVIMKPELLFTNPAICLAPYVTLMLAWIYGWIRMGKLTVLHLYSNKIFGSIFTVYFLMGMFVQGVPYGLLYLSFFSGVLAPLEQILIFTFFKKQVSLEVTSIFKLIHHG